MTDDIKITLFQPEDAQDICDCYREIYGDDFPIRYVYDPEEIIKRFDGINHRTAVARSGEGEFTGLVSVFRSAPNPRMYEAGQLMIRKKFRKRGIAEQFARIVHDSFPTQIPTDAQFGEALCNHTISQQLIETKGFLPTALEMEWLPNKNFDDAENRPGNISLLAEFRIYNDFPHEIFVHPAYADFVNGLCNGLNVKRTIKSETTPGTGATRHSAAIIRESEIATLTVTEAGADWPEILNDFETEAASCQLHIQIDISQPSAPWAIDIMRQRGFFLSGYLPLWFKGDGFMLQKLAAAPDFTLPQLYSEKGKLIMDAVQADYERTVRE